MALDGGKPMTKARVGDGSRFMELDATIQEMVVYSCQAWGG